MGLTFLVVVLGLATMTRSAKNQTFLNRDQTDEWKGWMQFMILIYHYTGASKVDSIYDFIRLTVASYLFMTGFGHTCYFLRKGDFSFKRVAGVLVRLNLLSCVLPYMMNTDYMFYYFAPLVTFWFGVVYLTMRIGSSRNQSNVFLLAKIFVSAAVVTVITKAPEVLEAIFGVLSIVFKTHWNVDEWRFRVFLDMWIVYFGMFAGIIVTRMSDNEVSEASYVTWKRLAVIVSALAIPGFMVFQQSTGTKFIYNLYHPYNSFIPIIAFLVLRNCTQLFRNSHSAVYAWLGRCSLETFTLQFHIWMAADTKGLLSTGVFDLDSHTGRLADFIVLTVIFFYVSWCVADATGVLTAWIMGAGGEAKKSTSTMNGSTRGQGDLEGATMNGNHDLNGEAEAQSMLPNEEKMVVRERSYGIKDLRIRVGIVLVGMWMLNLVSLLFLDRC